LWWRLSIGLHSARAGNFIREARDSVGSIFQPGARGRRGAEGLRGTFQREFCLTASTRPAAQASDRAADTLKDLRAETTLAASHRPHPSALPASYSNLRPDHGRGTVQMLNSSRMASTARNALRVGSIRYRARLYRQGFPTHAANATVATNRQGSGSTHPDDARVERHEC
jgi:hypothetical protein